MKIKCTKCGKRYDHDLYSGICPKCGNVYRQTNTETINMPEWNNINTIDKANIEDISPLKKASAKTKRNIKRSPLYSKITVLLLLAIVITAVIPPVAAYYLSRQNYKKLSLPQPVEPVEVVIGESFTYENDGAALDIIITDVSIDTDERFAVPEGYEIVTVSYQASERNLSTSPDSEITYTWEIRYGINPYLVTKQHEYLCPINTYDIDKVKEYDYQDAKQFGISDDFIYDEGILYYLVKENDTAGLWISCNKYDAAKYQNSALDKTFEIKNMEVSR